MPRTSKTAPTRRCLVAVITSTSITLAVHAETLPNPGLLPTRREREEQYAIVRRAIAAMERRGGTADGQIAVTRSAGRTIAKVARRRRVRYVVMDDSAPSGMRRVTEGSITAIVRRRLGGEAELELVTGAPARNS